MRIPTLPLLLVSLLHWALITAATSEPIPSTNQLSASSAISTTANFELKDSFRTSFLTEIPKQSKSLLLKRAIQGVLILALLSPCWFVRPIRNRFLKLSPLQKGCLILFSALTLIGQTLSFSQYDHPQKADHFPFTRFAMFVGSKDRLTTQEYQRFKAIDDAGNEIQINPFHTFRSIRSPTLFSKLKFLSLNLENASNPAKQELARRESRQLLQAFTDYYRVEKGITLKSVTFYKDTADYTDRSSPAYGTQTLMTLSADEI